MRERAQRFDPRQTMEKPGFEVFHYREPTMHTVEVHHHDFYEVYYLLEGRVEYWVEGRIVSLEPGDLLLMSPMQLHRPVLTRGQICERIVLWIHKDYLRAMEEDGFSLADCFDAPGHNHHIRTAPSERSALTARLAELVREAYSQEQGSSLCARGILMQFMVQLNRLAVGAAQPGEQGRQLSALVQRVLSYIHENPMENITLESLAERFFVSKYHLSHAFTREVGVSPYRYSMLRRLVLARQLLSEGQSAGTVSRQCGFSDYTSFYRAFRTEYGISPSQCR